ncbi:non-ribosomal peptide synthetase [Xanthomonas hortorum]|uniref:Tyrocidine synthase 3 n=1 Tax=Xanthomonas hortorum pv. carotae TaxID=487904 RepID=A0A6V7DJ40_9XANT|nr:non-ribosomal peptide synthetase [Xanthomonas hortorum]ETC88064.1 nonribosomal peptide synthetase DhbF [Xanthomonas hortorum pv. carotae str. M081]CAD0335378.1 Tyrocidine synthase 3 [Xanthomonas hortorum pv. carotae]CAD0335387.1 Tyrocidine synthase 3 [Xanthomonas hortorum pv. carotae]
MPLSFAQQRLWFLDQLEGPSATYIMPMGLRLRGALDRGALRAALHALVARHEALRSCFRQRRLPQENGDIATAPLSTCLLPTSCLAEQVQAERVHSEQVHIELLPPEQALVLHEQLLTDHALNNHFDPDAELRCWIAYEASTPFQLDRDAPIRFRLLQLSLDEHALLITQHHSASDGWSVGVLLHELSALYASCLRGQPDPLPPLPIQYPDYATWQRQWLEGQRRQQQLDYWQRQLAGAPSLLDLPLDRPRPPQQDFSGAEVAIHFDADLSHALETLARRHGCTVFMTVLAAWGALLSRLCRQDCVLVGIPVAGRTRAELEPLIGFFVNTLAIRFDAPASVSTAALLAQVRQQVLDAQAHQDVPFEQVVQAVQPVRSSAHTPLVQTLLAWEQDAVAGVVPHVSGADADHPKIADDPWAALDPQRLQIPAKAARFDLTLQLRSGDEPVGQRHSGNLAESCVQGTLSYATAVFDAATANRIVGYLQSLLRAMAADSTVPLDTVALLDAHERQQLLVDFQPAAVVYPCTLLHELIEQQVQRTPHAIAVAQDQLQLDYAALDAQANQLAHHLRQLGVGPDVRVAICAQRSPMLVVGLLAILKAGGAYVPLDPEYPAQRLADMLADSQPLALLVDAYACEHLPLLASDALHRVSLLDTELADSVLLCKGLPSTLAVYQLDQPNTPWDHQPTTTPHVPALEHDHLAYVIYTSGSTGTPKGAMNTHRGVVNRLLWMQDTYALSPDDVVLQKTPISFDVSVWELFWPLLSGARLQLARPGGHKDPAYLGAIIAEAAVTTLHFVPSMLDAFLATDAPQHCSGLTRVICSGEALPGQLVQRFRTQLPGVQLHNLYGPTEAAIDVSFWDCTANPDTPDNTPIGTPVANTQLYVLDTHLQPVPIGVAGELHIGGVQVARGYLDRPELTAQRFIPDPFRHAPDAQLYKTGDLARWRADGVLEYLGRNDDQVKIRGLRIEPGEIAARLATHSDVRDAVVLARKDQSGQLRLVAYYLATTALPIETLRSHLTAQLPDYMVPAAYVHLDALPLTPNGKLDRRALPAPTEAALTKQDFVPPQGPIECTIAAHWCELLGVHRVGRDDQFFALGGHSLLAIHLIERLRADGLHAEVRNLFASPTLAGFAASLRSNTETSGAPAVPPNRITPDLTQLTPQHLPLADLTQQDIDRVLEQVPGGLANVQDIYALSPFQHGLLFHHLLASAGDPYILSAQWAFADRPAAQRYLAALQAVIDRHDILRSAVLWEGLSEPVQVVLRHAPLQVNVLDPAALEPNDQTSAQLDDLITPLHHRLDLHQAPLMHATLVHDAHAQRWLLALRWHHMVGDHATLDLLMDEIQQHLDEHAPQLPPPSPFRALVAHTRQPEAAVQQQHFFRRLLGDVDTATAPFGLVGLHPDGAPVQEHHLPLDPALSERLRTQAKAAGASLASLCHLAWGLVMARAAGADDAVFGTVLLGRMGQADAQLMGPCINVLPVRVRSNSDAARTALQQLHAQLAELLLHEHASLSMVQRCSGVPAPAPLFNSLINYRHQSPARAQHTLGGAQLLHARECSPLPLVISVEDFGTALGLTAQALPEIGAARVCRFMQSALLQLVQALEQAPDTPLHDIDLLPAEEAARLRNRCSTARPIDEHALHRWFEIQAQRIPEALAVECGEQRLSYAELDLQADRLAHYLHTAGVAPERLVAVIATPGPQAMTAILATLKAGGAYLALDPRLPTARLMQLLADSAPLLVLADSAGVQQLGAAHDLKVCALDDPAPAWKNLATTAPALPDLSPHHLAYVVYTSGSSGAPKAVLVEHHSTANLVAAQLAAFGAGPGDRVAQLAPHGVDAHVFEWLLALASGASLHVPPATQARSGESLHQWLAQSQITHAVLPPAVLQSLPHTPLPHLQTLIAAGDVLPAALAQQWAPGRRLFNAYGPSEATVWSTLHVCGEDEHAPPAIGLPIANTRIYLLDSAGRLVPDGTPGEICITGRTVARGYLGHAALSVAAFVADPFNVGERMYRSGDLARWRSDGTLEFLGRRDRQLKLRGYRVDPGEIEAALREACSELAEVLVMLYNTDQAEPVLVAYLVARPEVDRQSLSPAALRARLAARLPAHMVPAAYVQLDALPLSINGKHNLRALPAPQAADRAIAAFSAPRGATETQIATLWTELLALPQVGRDDAFFAIGGDSMRAIAFLQQASRLGLALTLRQLYQAPTPAGLAALLQTDTDANATHVGSPADLPPAPSQDVRSSP